MSCLAYVFVFENTNRAFSPLYIRTQVPKQENSCDCGVFMLTYVEHFFRAFSDARYILQSCGFLYQEKATGESDGVFDKFRRL